MEMPTTPESNDNKFAEARPGGYTRRDFLKRTGTAGLAASLGIKGIAQLWALGPAENISNPLAYYPNRDWERIYRDQYRYDRSFTFICAPNDTHMCRLRAFIRNGVLLRTEQNYDHQDYADLYGNKATPHWNPRGCPKGYTLQRRIYGPYRLKGPVLRKGWKDWADEGFPSLSENPALRSKYKFDDRGNDSFVRLSWDQITSYAAKGLIAVAKTYSGEQGKQRLEKDGYLPEMIHETHGAGTRTMKMGSNLPLHGVVGKFGLFRFGNGMGLLDHHVRGVSEENALGVRDWTEYTWRGDQAPGMPFVHGLQGSDCDFNDLRHARLHVQVGKNLVENKMPESHWFIEMMERGGKIVSITPDYSAPATKADYWIGVRPGLSDLSLFLFSARYIIENKMYDEGFVTGFTDFPLLVRTDTLKRLRPSDFIKDYEPDSLRDGPSYRIQGLTDEQREKIGDWVVFDKNSDELKPLNRDQVGGRMREDGLDPALEWKGRVQLLDGQEVEVMTLFELYKINLQDYDLQTVSEITGAKPELIQQLAHDLGSIKPAAIHFGEGVNHYFHATLHNRGVYLPMMLTGNLGNPGSGVYGWAGNYKGAVFQGSNWSGAGAMAYVTEDPFHPVIDPHAPFTKDNLRKTMHGEEVGYWGAGDIPFIVDTPKGRKNFTGHTHMPCPTKLMWYNNANLINQAKWAYHIIHNVLPKVDMIVDQQIEWTGSAEYADLVFPVNSWVEFENLEAGSSCSNPFLQLWGGKKWKATEGMEPLYDSFDDAMVFAKVAEKLTEFTGDRRFRDYWHFVLNGETEVYLDRVFSHSTTTSTRQGPKYTCADIMNGKYGEPGSALMLYRTYPRIPFYEQVHESIPFYTDSGRLHSYCDLPEAIEYGENFIVHREGPEATPYLPNVIVSSNPYIRPEDYGISPEAVDADLRQIRNIKLPWRQVRETKNPLWEQGFRFFCSTPKSRHSVHSSWATVDWHWMWSCNFSDPYRRDKRLPGVAGRQIQVNPKDALELGIEDGDFVYVDANPEDRPYKGWKEGDLRYKAFRCMVHVKYNPGLPRGFTIMKHEGWMATERSVQAHETRPDGMALSPQTGYQASYRYGSHQSITRAWMMPMHQTDTLFHKKVGRMGFVFGFDIDNHAINSTPKETLVKLVKAESGGVGGRGTWRGARSGYTPGHETEEAWTYLGGGFVRIETENEATQASREEGTFE